MSEELPVMTPDNERWGEFTEKLGGPDGCDFTVDGTWICDNSRHRPFARKILTEMGFDVSRSLAVFDAGGGYCDCEILFNVENTWPARGRPSSDDGYELALLEMIDELIEMMKGLEAVLTEKKGDV